MLRRIISLFAGISSVLGYSAGYDSCINVPNHGSWATGCNSTFCANSPYTIQLMNNGATVNSYVPTTKYTISITSPMNFKGFILNSGLGSDIATFTTVAALQQGSGTLTLGTDTHVRQMTGCTNGLTHTSNTPVRQISAFWTAPPAGAGFVTFKAIIVVTQNGNHFASYRILPEASSNTTFTGTITPSRTVSASRSLTVSLSPSRSLTISPSRSLIVSPSTVVSVSPVPILSSTLSPTLIPTSVLSPSLVHSSSISESVSPSPSVTATETVNPSTSVIPLPSVTPTESVYPSSSTIPLPSVTPTESVYPSSSSVALPSVTPTESVYPSNSVISSASPSASATYDGTQLLRTSNTSGVNTTGISVGVFFAAGATVAIVIASAIAFKNKNKKRAVSSRDMPISDYVTQNPVESVPVTVSRFSLTNKTKKEFSPMQSIA